MNPLRRNNNNKTLILFFLKVIFSKDILRFFFRVRELSKTSPASEPDTTLAIKVTDGIWMPLN